VTPEYPDHALVIPVYKGREFTIAYEQFRDMTFIHGRVHVPWSRGVKRRVNEVLDNLFALHGGPFYATETTGDSVHPHFLRLLGFQVDGSVIDEHGSSTRLWKLHRERRDGQQNQNRPAVRPNHEPEHHEPAVPEQHLEPDCV
jgi:hypothetical protein